MIKTLSHAVGVEDLAETYREVLERHERSLAFQIIDATVKLDHFWTFPESQIDSLHRRVGRNHLAFGILRRLIASHFYMYTTAFQVRQKYTTKFDIKFLAPPSPKGGLTKSED